MRPQPGGSIPEIKIGYTPAGRETLEAITDELIPLPVSFERESSSPEITVREGVIERDTLAAIMEEAGAGLSPEPAAAPPAATPATSTLEIFEMATYLIRGGDISRLASEALRRSFVEENLLARLPVKTMSEIDRIDVTPWTVQGTFVLRVWCRTGAAR